MNESRWFEFIKKYLSGNIIRILTLVIIDILSVLACDILALIVRFDFKFAAVPNEYWSALSEYWYINVATTIIIFFIFKMYRNLWRFAGVREFLDAFFACTISAVSNTVGMYLMKLNVPRSFPFLYLTMFLFLVVGGRFSYRLIILTMIHLQDKKSNSGKKTMLIGGGSAGVLFLNELRNSKFLNNDVKCIIDDDPTKHGTVIAGIPIVGNAESIPYYVGKFDIEDIIFAIPTINEKRKKEILNICAGLECKIHFIPVLYQIVNQEVAITKLRDVEIEDLLGRPAVDLEIESVMDYVKDKVVLVTGGGGSIGSELCRQIAGYKPKKLIIVDIYENNAYEIQMELTRHFPELDIIVLIASVRNTKRIDSIFEKYRPQIVYHAAAHKHVPLMEDSPNEAIKNNVMGTYHVACAADKYKAEKFVLISTDKAVRPTNIMGASKRMCEMVVQGLSERSDTEFVAVRFGNVLGSNGSVIPLFKKQISEGGPVTVTHPDIIRYFMTIPEAVSLVLQAGAMATGGEIFILDMGEPVKIAELAKNLIRLSGFKVDEDIKIEYTGLRPGEKLYEELLIDEENIKKTLSDRIFIGGKIHVDWEWFTNKITELESMAYDECDNMKELVTQVVPEYTITPN